MSLSFMFAQSSSGAAIATADNDDDDIANLDMFSSLVQRVSIVSYDHFLFRL